MRRAVAHAVRYGQRAAGPAKSKSSPLRSAGAHVSAAPYAASCLQQPGASANGSIIETRPWPRFRRRKRAPVRENEGRHRDAGDGRAGLTYEQVSYGPAAVRPASTPRLRTAIHAGGVTCGAVGQCDSARVRGHARRATWRCAGGGVRGARARGMIGAASVGWLRGGMERTTESPTGWHALFGALLDDADLVSSRIPRASSG